MRESNWPDRRGGRQYQLPKVYVRDLHPGARTAFTEFETAVRENAFAGTLEPDEADLVRAVFGKKKQQLLRKMLRMQNGDDQLDTEAMRKDLVLMARLLRNIEMAPETAREQISVSQKAMKVVSDLIDNRNSKPYYIRGMR